MHIPRKPGFLRAVTENVKYAVVCASRPTKVGNDTPILEDALPGIIHLGVILRPSTGVSQRATHAQRTHCGTAFLHRFVCKPFGSLTLKITNCSKEFLRKNNNPPLSI